ncbi:MAG: RpiB/LacA/LacB family sugar-phosphate isomerase [bacterium]|nr:RpiB/LacA/LacB family sugar-phosphate isomerase [bacterium]
MNIYLASDHAGFELKNHLAEYIKNLGFTVIDKGPFSMDPGDDYPDYIRLVAEEILKNPDSSRGIILGSSGQGEAMAANRFKGIRAAVYYGPPCTHAGEESKDVKIIELSRQHNNANIFSLGAHFLTNTEAESAVKLWLETPFSNDERHTRRLGKLDA